MWAFLVVHGCTDEPLGERGVAFDDPPVLVPYLPEAEPLVSVPVFGGTLESAPAVGGFVAADPDGNRLLRVVGDEVVAIDLGDNARPFRVHVEDTRAWVTLRGTGELAAVALDTASVEWRTRLCLEPRGVARSPYGPLVVACAGGEIVEVGDDGGILRFVVLDADLRDVVAGDDVLLASRFATAGILEIDPDELVVTDSLSLTGAAGVAWRMRAHDGGALILHQNASDIPIDLTDEEGTSRSPTPLAPTGERGKAPHAERSWKPSSPVSFPVTRTC